MDRRSNSPGPVEMKSCSSCIHFHSLRHGSYHPCRPGDSRPFFPFWATRWQQDMQTFVRGNEGKDCAIWETLQQ
jgi:hypothetical protein